MFHVIELPGGINSFNKLKVTYDETFLVNKCGHRRGVQNNMTQIKVQQTSLHCSIKLQVRRKMENYEFCVIACFDQGGIKFTTKGDLL
jgi:hypothetical protein